MTCFKSYEKLSVKDMREIIEEMQVKHISNAILVTDSSISSHVKAVTYEARPKYKIELFNEAELLVDITEHYLVPQHFVLTDQEKLELLKRVKAKESQLPVPFVFIYINLLCFTLSIAFQFVENDS
jgi:DNA-directed RNA polymerase I, II, and III subunit RPABC1